MYKEEFLKIIFATPQVLGLILDSSVLFLILRSTRHSYQTKNPHQINDEDSSKKGDDILFHITAVPSAQAGLTTLFGMGRGEPRRNNHLKRL